MLIEQCDLPLARGLCVLTGETGAGKSILLDALGLVLGQRAETRLVRHGKDQAQVTAAFDISANPAAIATLETLGLEPSNELLIRRSLTSDGKTKCFVNDVAVGVTALRTLGDTLVEIHGQHDGRGLLDPATHRELLDAYGELQPLATATTRAYSAWQEAAKALADTQHTIDAAAREQEYLQHMQKELAQLAAQPGEESALADARTLMMQSEKLAQTLHDAQGELASGKGAIGMVNTAQRILARSSLNVEGRFTTAIDALERASAELSEAETVIDRLLGMAQYDPVRLEQMEERLFALRAAARKYNVTPEQLPILLEEVSQKLRQYQQQQHTLTALQQTVTQTRQAYQDTAEKLSRMRVKAAKRLEKIVVSELDALKMGATQFKVLLEPLSEDRWSTNGTDNIQFQATTNAGAALAPLHRIASGGELSRFMLAMKVALAAVKSTPSIIFDEIDTGTGGAVADAIGQRLAQLGESHQVLVVTHLPQVAARGHHHLRVLKEEKSGATFTQVETLSTRTRKEELARMLAGAEVTTEARKAAEKLLQAAG